MLFGAQLAGSSLFVRGGCWVQQVVGGLKNVEEQRDGSAGHEAGELSAWADRARVAAWSNLAEKECVVNSTHVCCFGEGGKGVVSHLC